MSTIERGFNGNAVELNLPGKRVRVLRSQGAADLLKVVGEPITVTADRSSLSISSSNWFVAWLGMLLRRFYPQGQQHLVQEDPRIEGYDFLVVLPLNVTHIHRTNIADYSEEWID